jgi:hypothetical protein
VTPEERIVEAAKKLVAIDVRLNAMNCNTFLSVEFENAFDNLRDAVEGA